MCNSSTYTIHLILARFLVALSQSNSPRLQEAAVVDDGSVGGEGGLRCGKWPYWFFFTKFLWVPETFKLLAEGMGLVQVHCLELGETFECGGIKVRSRIPMLADAKAALSDASPLPHSPDSLARRWNSRSPMHTLLVMPSSTVAIQSPHLQRAAIVDDSSIGGGGRIASRQVAALILFSKYFVGIREFRCLH
jgi:hypothetical protein